MKGETGPRRRPRSVPTRISDAALGVIAILCATCSSFSAGTQSHPAERLLLDPRNQPSHTVIATEARNMRFICALSVLTLLLAVGCGGGGGGGCGMPGSTSDCSSGEICSNLSGDGNQCRAICTTQAQCPAGQSCLGVANTNVKSCQPSGSSTPTPTAAATPTPK